MGLEVLVTTFADDVVVVFVTVGVDCAAGAVVLGAGIFDWAMPESGMRIAQASAAIDKRKFIVAF